MAAVLLRAPSDRLPFDIRLDRHHYQVRTGGPFVADPADVATLLIHGCSLVEATSTEAPATETMTALDAPAAPAAPDAPDAPVSEPITYYGETADGTPG